MSNILVQNIKHTNNTTAQTIDTSGRTTVSIMNNDSTYRSDGGAVTQNLVQGVAKSWMNFDGTGTASIRDSLNVSSLSDNSTGQYYQNYTNNMNAVDYPGTGNAGKSAGSHTEDNSGYQNLSEISGLSTSTRTVFINKVSGAFVDRDHVTCLVHGDLA